MILVIDIGNSHCRFAVFAKDKLILRKHCIVKNWKQELKKIDLSAIEKAVLICVNEKPKAKICKYLKKAGKAYEIIGSPDYHLPCKNKKLLKNLGADRAANILGGLYFNKGKKPFIAIDCGTAITVDYCNEAGQFCGGVIMSGQQLMAHSLYDYTDKLPLLRFEDIKQPKQIIGTSTIESINSGLTYAMSDMIDGVITRMSLISPRKPTLYLCGGNAKIYGKISSHRLILQKDLTLWGGLCYANIRGA